MKEEQARLELLQQVDVSILEIKQELEEMARKKADMEAQAGEKTQQVEEKQQAIKQIEAKRSDLEKMLFLEQDRLKKTRGKLQGTGVRNPHAFSAQQREVDKIKKDIDSLESEILKSMEEMENQRKAIEKIQQELEETNGLIAELAKESEGRSGEMESRLKEMAGRREGVAGEIDNKILALYERVRTRYPRNAVVAAKNESCQGCHMNIPPQLFNEIQRGDKLINCPACQRILFFHTDEEEETSREAASG